MTLKTRPNVLLIITDQQARNAQGATGNPWANTPHLDRLSEKGVRFNKAYCTAPVCGPARSSLHTGRMPSDTKVFFNQDSERSETANICQLFHGAGYDTAWVGHRYRPNPLPSDDVPHFHKLQPSELGDGLGMTVDEPLATTAIDYLRRDHKVPFFLGVTLVNPHDICYWVMNKAPSTATTDELPSLPENFAVDADEPEFIQRCRNRADYGPENTYTRNWDKDKWRHYLHEYFSLTTRVDRAAGRILDTLSEYGLERDTVVLYTSDHGEGMAAHQWVVKLMLFENPVSVPFSLSWPGVIPEKVVDNTHLVSGIDVLPTLCDYAQIEWPEEVTGQSLRPVVENPERMGRKFVVSELHPEPTDPSFAGRMLRSERYKYLVFSHGRRRELLYDLARDPLETHDLACEKGHLAQLVRHRKLLARWIEEGSDTFAVPGS